MVLDMQGHDLTAIKSCSKQQLHRIQKITNECWKDGKEPFYKEIDNYFSSWKNFMQQNGFKLLETSRAWGFHSMQELDTTWIPDA